ncbi:MAG: GDSL-type esterase/lipase family protein [Thermoanaerobaculia bacterium]
MSSRLPRWLANALTAAAAIVVTLLLAEGVLRLVGYEYKPLKLDVGAHDDRGVHLFQEEHFVYDPELIWRPRPGRSVFNEQGFRGPVLAHEKPPGRLRLFTVGDSNTLGWAGPNGANWPAELQHLFERRGDPIDVVNAGVWGYASYQGVARMREVLPWQPDWVFISFGSNDAHPSRITDAHYLEYTSAGTGPLERWLQPFALGRLVLGALRSGSHVPEETTHRVPLEEYRENMRTMVEMARGAGARVLLLTRPYIGPIAEWDSWKRYAHDYNAATVELAEQLDTPLVDLYSEFKGRDELFADESHFTAEGHTLAAEAIVDRLLPELERSAATP